LTSVSKLRKFTWNIIWCVLCYPQIPSVLYEHYDLLMKPWCVSNDRVTLTEQFTRSQPCCSFDNGYYIKHAFSSKAYNLANEEHIGLAQNHNCIYFQNNNLSALWWFNHTR